MKRRPLRPSRRRSPSSAAAVSFTWPAALLRPVAMPPALKPSNLLLDCPPPLKPGQRLAPGSRRRGHASRQGTAALSVATPETVTRQVVQIGDYIERLR